MTPEVETTVESNKPHDLVTGKTHPESDVVDSGEGEQCREHRAVSAQQTERRESEFQRFYSQKDSESDEEISEPENAQSPQDLRPNIEYGTQESCEDESNRKPKSLNGLRRDQIQGLDGVPVTFAHGDKWRWVDQFLGKGSYGECRAALVFEENINICVKEIMINSENLEEACMEARMLSKLSCHDSICQTYGATYDSITSRFFIFMELMSGGTMEELMIERCNMRKEIKIRHIRRWTIQIMRGLVFLHHNGIAHYDMKADNVLLDFDHKRVRVCLGDFGNSSSRCQQCTSCNERASYVELSCDACSEWHKGRADDVRETAYLVYRLLVVPESCGDIKTLETAEISGRIKKQNIKLGIFVEACLKLKPSKDLLSLAMARP